MISWIVASHNETILNNNLLSTLKLEGDDELIVMRDQPSITIAYARGQEQATQPVRCYIQHDVRLLKPERLRRDLIFFTENAGMVGVIGGGLGNGLHMPWWVGTYLYGSVQDPRQNVRYIDFGDVGRGPIVIDGLLMATREQVDWDESWPGWHGYDHDACAQFFARGLDNVVIPDGRLMVKHNTSTPLGSVENSPAWIQAIARFNEKWGHS